MKGKHVIFSIVSIVFCLSLFIGNVESAPITLRYSTYFPKHEPFAKAQIEWMDEIEKRTKGAVKFEKFFDGTLIGTKESWEELVRGVADLVHIPTNLSPGMKGAPLTVGLSYSWIGVKDIRAVAKIAKQLHQEFPELRAQWSAVKPFGQLCAPDFNLHTKKPIPKLSDLKGLQIRGIGPWPKKTMEKLGASIVAIPLTDVYISLQKGIVDGIIHEYAVLQTFKLAEVVRYSTDLKGVYMTAPDRLCMNLNTWNKLPREVQVVFEDMEDWLTERTLQLREESLQSGIRFAREKKVEFLSLEPGDVARLHSLLLEEGYEEAKKLDEKGLPGTKIFNRLQELIKQSQ